MAMAIEAIEVEVMNLAPADRSDLLVRLNQTAGPDSGIQKLWNAEARRRHEDLLAGRTTAISGELVFKSILSEVV